MKRILNILYRILLLISSIIWGLVGLHMVVTQVINIIKRPFIFEGSLFWILIGLTLIASVILLWNRRMSIRLITSIYLLFISFLLIIGASLSATLEDVNYIMLLYPYICFVLSFLAVVLYYCHKFIQVPKLNFNTLAL